MKLFLIKYHWGGERYFRQEDEPQKILAFKTLEDVEEHIQWETAHWDEQTWANKGGREKLIEIVEIDAPDERGIDP